MAKTQAERMVRVETNLENLTNTVNKGFADINDTLKNISENYVLKAAHDKEMAELHIQVDEAKRRNGLQIWLTSTLASVMGVVMTILIQSYVSK